MAQATHAGAVHITREHGTEHAFTSPLNKEKRQGMFSCVACGHEVVTYRQLPDCPTCGGNLWERDEWSPFSRMAEAR